MTNAQRAERLRLLTDVTNIPTASGREQGMVNFIENWVSDRQELVLTRDQVGNLVVSFSVPPTAPPQRSRRSGDVSSVHAGLPLYVTAHMDHPAFVVERIVAPGVVELSFRGGVMEPFFKDAPIVIHTRVGERLKATVKEKLPSGSGAGDHYLAELDVRAAAEVSYLDIATWDLPASHIDPQGLLQAPGCDDQSAVAAALAMMGEIVQRRREGQSVGDVRLLFTRAEEIGFLGAIAACRLGTIQRGARVIALENSRSFEDSPIGGGPIVRVGDRISVFTPWLTAACGERAEALFGGPAQPRATETNAGVIRRPWQRKLMAGGACEASVFCHYGYEATCLCLPLGNYHNMPHLAAMQAGTYDASVLGPPRCAPEFIHTGDYLGLVDLLVDLASAPPEQQDSSFSRRLDKLLAEKGYVLGMSLPETFAVRS